MFKAVSIYGSIFRQGYLQVKRFVANRNNCRRTSCFTIDVCDICFYFVIKNRLGIFINTKIRNGFKLYSKFSVSACFYFSVGNFKRRRLWSGPVPPHPVVKKPCNSCNAVFYISSVNIISGVSFCKAGDLYFFVYTI